MAETTTTAAAPAGIVRSGPTTKYTSSVALGLARILVGPSASNIAAITQVLDMDDDSLGALNTSNFNSNVEYWRMESGFPAQEDISIPISETAALECEFKELNARNLAFARGIDASTGYDDPHGGEIPLGNMAAPAFVRMEAIYTYPNQVNHMYIIFPRANVTSSVAINFAASDNVNVPITIEAKRADSGVDGGDAAWDIMSLGRIYFD